MKNRLFTISIILSAVLLIGSVAIYAANGYSKPVISESNKLQLKGIHSDNFAETALDLILAIGQNKFLDGYINPEEYLVGPGDQFTIAFVDKEMVDVISEIRPDGNIFIKSVGLIYLGNISLHDAIEKLTSKIGKYYASSFFTVQLTDFRFVKINVTGKIKNPGIYYAPATWRVSEVLALAGGILPGGTTRNIKLSGLEFSKSIDLLGFNRLGENDKNPMICWGNSIFVSDNRNHNQVVSITGYVNSPGVYELTESDDLLDLINIAGGFSVEQKNLEIAVNSSTSETNLNFSAESIEDASHKPAPGDNIMIQWIDAIPLEKSVIILGAVQKPGYYHFSSDNFNLEDLLKLCGGITSNGFSKMTMIYRNSWKQNAGNFGKINGKAEPNGGSDKIDYRSVNYISMNPRDAVDFSQILLADKDSIYVPVKTGMISVAGAVVSPGLIKIKNGAGVDYYLESAGGIGYNADRGSVVIINPITGGKIIGADAGEIFDGEIIFVPEKETDSKP